jgi:hypothetical protein
MLKYIERKLNEYLKDDPPPFNEIKLKEFIEPIIVIIVCVLYGIFFYEP